VALWSLTQFSIWLAPSFAVLLICRVILGLGEGPSAGLSFHAAGKWFKDKDRNLPVALQNVGSFGGIAVAAPGLTYIISKWGWHWAFFAVGVAGVIWMVLWFLIGKEGPYSGTPEGTPAKVEDSAFELSVRVPYRKVLLSRSFIGYCCVGLAAYWALAIVSAWLPLYLRTAQGYSAADAAKVVMAISLTAIVALIGEAAATSYLMKRGVSTRVARGFMAAGSTAVAGLFIILVNHTVPGTAQIVVLCIGFGLGLVTFTTGAVSISEFVPVLQRGAVLGIYVAIITSAGIFAPAIFGWIVQAGSAATGGYDAAVLTTGLFVGIGGVLGFLLINPQRDAGRILAVASTAPVAGSPAS